MRIRHCSDHRENALVMVVKWCVSRGEPVTIIVSTAAAAAELRSQFTSEELESITLSLKHATARSTAGV